MKEAAKIVSAHKKVELVIAFTWFGFLKVFDCWLGRANFKCKVRKFLCHVHKELKSWRT